jgi:hypothetical protein
LASSPPVSAAAASGAQKDNAEIGVHSGSGKCGFDTSQYSRAGGERGIAQRRGSGFCTAQKIVRRHAMAGCENVDVARFRRLDFIAACCDESFCNLFHPAAAACAF